MKQANSYIDLKGQAYSLADLNADERKLVSSFQAYARKKPAWSAYSNFWMAKVHDHYAASGLSRRVIRETVPYRIGQDLGSRVAIAQGLAREPDYRDELDNLIRDRFQTRREFCKATGLSEDMLSHVLSKRKHLAVNTLEDSLRRIGYTLRITPAP